MSTERVRIMRLILFEGPREWVEKQIERSITGTKLVSANGIADAGKITVRTIEEFPEIVKSHEGTHER